MSREIKFRAFHKANNAMIYFDNEKAANDQYQSSAMVRLMAGDDSGYLMQYTGLKDKNGVEIYEGDVVATKWLASKHYWKYVITTASEQFGGMLFAMCVEDNLSATEDGETYTFEKRVHPSPYRSYVPSGKNAEVIGNIYENPELIASIGEDDE